MVGRWALLLTVLGWLTLPAAGFGADPLFGMTVESDQVEYGKPVYVDLHTRYSEPHLNTLDLSPLNRDFVVHTPENVDQDAGSGRQRWRIQLYPRRTGELPLPALVFQGIEMEPASVRVTPPVDHMGDAPIRVSSEVGDTAVWINQAVRVTLQVESDYRYGRLETEAARKNGIEIVARPLVRDTLVQNGKQRTRYRVGWVLYPQTTGVTRVKLPPVKYLRDGVVTHQFYPPEIALQVRALPAYVPPTMPVGRIDLEASMPDRLFLVKRELAFLTLRITLDGPPAQHLSGLLRQLKSNETVAFYTPQVMEDATASQASSRSNAVYQVPFSPTIMGQISLPEVRLQYFDPATGKIETRNHTLGGFIAVDQWIVYAGATLLSLGAIALLGFAGRWLKRQLKIYQSYRMALHKFQQAATPAMLKSALMDIAGAESWPTNLTLAAWLHYWVTRYPGLSVSDDIHRLQGWLYGRDEATVEDIRPSLVSLCYRRMPLLKLLGYMQRGA